jgi:hypothetical protein
VPGYDFGGRETVVTTTRRIVVAPPAYEYDGYYGAPRTVVTTRRVVAPAPLPEESDEAAATGFRPAAYPLPPRRVLKSGPDYGPAPAVGAPPWRERVVVTRRSPEPVVIEERRVVTTRRVLGPAPAVSLDWDE